MPPYEMKQGPNLMEVAPDFIDDQCLTRFTNQALKWIAGKAEDARKGKPFFLYLPYTSPHKPVIPIEKRQKLWPFFPAFPSMQKSMLGPTRNVSA